MKKLLFAAFTLFVIGCSEKDESDPCTGVSCLNGGVCDDGTCKCPEGYYGVNCEKIYTDAFVGEYDCHIVGKFSRTNINDPQYDDSVLFDCTYTATISNDSTTNKWVLLDTVAPFINNGNGAPHVLYLLNPNSFIIYNNSFVSLMSNGTDKRFDECTGFLVNGTLNNDTLTLVSAESCMPYNSPTNNYDQTKIVRNFICTMTKK